MRTLVTRLTLALLTAALLSPLPIAAQTPVSEGPAAGVAPEAGTPAIDLLSPTPGQETVATGAKQQNPGPGLLESTAEALRSVAGVLKDTRLERAAALAANDQNKAKELDLEIRQQRLEFASLVTSIDVKKFEDPTAVKFNLQEELVETVRPIVSVVKDWTEAPREAQQVTDELESARSRRVTAEQASARVTNAIAEFKVDGSPGSLLAAAEAQRELTEHWQPLLRSLGSKILVLGEKQRIQNESKTTIWQTLTTKFDEGVQDSGISILWCLGVFLLTFFAMRLLSNLIVTRKRKRGFAARLVTILMRILTVVVAVVAILITAYARGEFVIFTIGILFVVAIGWVMTKQAPQYLEEIRMLLNVGSVREGERILVDGLPYRVESLRFYTKLRNPALKGGTLRMPIGQLIGQRSRLGAADEPWFPCEQGDIVMLGDSLGYIEMQTPEVVIYVKRNDAPQTIPTTDFLAMNPRNLSHGFEIAVTFGIDYSHQELALQRVPAAFHEAVVAALEADVDGDAMRSIRVELKTAGASSLDFVVLVGLEGKAAMRYKAIQRRINQALVAACTEHGFGIPFPQLQVHGVKSA
ncbi:MAG: hypothetical protein ACI9SE_001690 [Neolewinella sp.]|jgi:hypothetical protein